MEEKHKQWMHKAIEKAKENLPGESGGPFGAVIVKDQRLLSAASNKVIAHNDPTAHAEIQAIREACRVLNTYDLTDCNIYASCEPCPMCLAAIYWAGIDKIYYAANRYDAQYARFDDSRIYDELIKDHELRDKPMTQIEFEEGKKVFKIWNDQE